MKIFMTVLDAKGANKKCRMSPTTFETPQEYRHQDVPLTQDGCLFRCIQSKKQALAVCQDEAQRRRFTVTSPGAGRSSETSEEFERCSGA